MEKGYQRCPRCSGRKDIYKLGGAYSLIDTGGVKVKCPMCLGEGEIKDLATRAKEIKDSESCKLKRGRPKKVSDEEQKDSAG